MRARKTEAFERRKAEIMENCFACYAERGLNNVGIKGLAETCGCTSANLYTYFNNLEDLVVQATAHCMSKVEDDFMARAPHDPADLDRFIEETPYWTAKTHGKSYRLMYQIYTNPKYLECGKEFYKGVHQRYAEYAAELEGKLGIPKETLEGLIYIFVRACVHYALFEDEHYLQLQLAVIKDSVALYKSQASKPAAENAQE